MDSIIRLALEYRSRHRTSRTANTAAKDRRP